MDELRLSIGELARRAGVSVDTIRYYEKRGLLHRAAIHARRRLVESPENRPLEKLWKDNTLCGRIRHR